MVGQRHPQGQPHRGAGVRRHASRVTPTTAATARAASTTTARSTSSICGRNSRGSASAASCSPPRGATCCRAGCKSMVVWALSDNEPAVGVLSRARRQGGGALVREVRQPSARQGRLRLEWLTTERLRTPNASAVGSRRIPLLAAVLPRLSSVIRDRRSAPGRVTAPARRRSRRPRAPCWRAGTRSSSVRRRPAPA